MSFDSGNFPDNWERKHIFKNNVLCVLSNDGSVMLINYVDASSIDENFIASFKKVWFLEKSNRIGRIRCVWEARRLGALPDMIIGLMSEWYITEQNLEEFGADAHYFNCDSCLHSRKLDSFGAYSCISPDNNRDLWVEIRPRSGQMPGFPDLFYPEEMLGRCNAYRHI